MAVTYNFESRPTKHHISSFGVTCFSGFEMIFLSFFFIKVSLIWIIGIKHVYTTVTNLHGNLARCVALLIVMQKEFNFELILN